MHVSEIDFSILGLILPICLLIFIPFMFVCIIFGFQWLWLIGAIGALLFSLFIVWDRSAPRRCTYHPLRIQLI